MIQENAKVMIVDDDTEIIRLAKLILNASNDIVVFGGPAQSNVFELHNFHRHYNEPKLKAPVEHGAYRQFLKRDKRKNFKLK
jgi:CheY-like chemotaxis protein